MVLSVGSSGFRQQSTSRQQLWPDFATLQPRSSRRGEAWRTFILPDAEVTRPQVAREKLSRKSPGSKRHKHAGHTYGFFRRWVCFICGRGCGCDRCFTWLECEAGRCWSRSPRAPAECVNISARMEPAMWQRQRGAQQQLQQ